MHSRTAALDSPWTWHDVCESSRFQNIFPRNPSAHREGQDDSGEDDLNKQSKPARPRHRLHHIPRSRSDADSTGHGRENKSDTQDSPSKLTGPALLSTDDSQAGCDALPSTQHDLTPLTTLHGRRRKHLATASTAHQASSSSSPAESLDQHPVEQSHTSSSKQNVSQPASTRGCLRSTLSRDQDASTPAHASFASPRSITETDDVLHSSSSSTSSSAAEVLTSDLECPAERELKRLKERLDRATTRLANSFDQDSNNSCLSITDMMQSQDDIDILSPSIGKGDVVFQFWRHVPFG